MRANDNMRTAAEVLVDQLIASRRRARVLRAGRELSRGARCVPRPPDSTVTVCRQEGGAAMMAEAVGKATGRPGICFVTRGPGATNAVAGPAHRAPGFDADDSVRRPGSRATMREREAFQEIDLSRGVRLDRQMGDRDRRSRAHSGDWCRARSTPRPAGRPGPVVIALPEDMQRERIAVADAPPFEPVEIWPGAHRHGEAAEAAVGGGAPDRDRSAAAAGRRHACAALARFAERFALPVATTFRRAHLFDALHPCYAGDLGLGVNPKLLARVKAADVVVAVGDAARRDAVARLHAV